MLCNLSPCAVLLLPLNKQAGSLPSFEIDLFEKGGNFELSQSLFCHTLPFLAWSIARVWLKKKNEFPLFLHSPNQNTVQKSMWVYKKSEWEKSRLSTILLTASGQETT